MFHGTVLYVRIKYCAYPVSYAKCNNATWRVQSSRVRAGRRGDTILSACMRSVERRRRYERREVIA